MEIKPVPQIESPAYPTQDELLADKATLQDCLPCRWRKTKGLAGALSLLLAAGATGCGDGTHGRPTVTARNDPYPTVNAPVPVFSESYPWGAVKNSSNPVVVEAGYWIRSIFRERHVNLGCVAMMPPAVLQEDAAAHGAGLVGKQVPAEETPIARPAGEGLPGLPELPSEQGGPRNPLPEP